MNNLSADEQSPTPVPEFSNCFVCGINNPGGLGVKFFDHGDCVKASFTPKKIFAGYRSVVHGGIVSALLDEVMIWAVHASEKRFGVTAELTVRFVKPMLIGKTYTLEGKVLDKRGRLKIATGRISDEHGGLIATAKGKIIPVTEKEMEKLQRSLGYD
jgi:uncharacterized protein (TIGR00369 family)